ncbi:MAG: aminopeptidase P N-terminal domain-containing protein [Saprospiraceae bacterium]|nr:aminopeptidase P N-terminal domain-containing protein [Saprospiraceae bacterium]
MRATLLFLFLFIISQFSTAQETPKDYLSGDFHKERREALRKLMPKNAVAVFFANPVRNRANDVDFQYHQDPDFYYLTGYNEPHSVLLIFSDWQESATGEKYNEIIFTQSRNPQAEMWTGRRLGAEGAETKLGFKTAVDHQKFKDYGLEFKQFSKVMFFDFQNDIRDERGEADLYDLQQQFKQKANIPAGFSGMTHRMHQIIKDEKMNFTQKKESLYRMTRFNPMALNDPIIKDFMEVKDNEQAMKLIAKIPNNNLDVELLDGYMDQLREIKSAEELKLLRKAVDVSCVGQMEVMKAMHPGMSESEIQGIHEFVFKKYGSEYEGYPSIVGGGQNGCILHYVENNKPKVGNELVLMDLGAEYHGYTADVTRTIPANGKFSEEQKAIYNIVLEAQNAGFEACKVGNDFGAPDRAAREVVNRRLAELGLIKSGEQHSYFPHGTSHYLGLDVHDRGTRDKFKPGTVITVEPGIYIPEGSPCDKKWWGIAVRIEDDILITADGWENLSARAPRTVEEIERVMAMPSPLDDFVLPDLDGKKN